MLRQHAFHIRTVLILAVHIRFVHPYYGSDFPFILSQSHCPTIPLHFMYRRNVYEWKTMVFRFERTLAYQGFSIPINTNQMRSLSFCECVYD